MTLGDRIGVMRDGRLEQLGPPLEVYERPATAFVAGFVGSPAMNLLTATVEDGRVRSALFAVDAPGAALPAAGTALTLGVRPPHLRLAPPDEADLRAEVDVVEHLGDQVVLHLATDPPLLVAAPPEAGAREGDVVGVSLRRDRLHLFDADGRRLPG
jgi:ABC-type sugar transport system ATPase subunit